MNSKSVRQRRFARLPPAEASGVGTGAPSKDRSTAPLNKLKQHQEDAELKAKYEERKLTLERLERRTDELNEGIQKVKALNVSSDVLLKTRDAIQAAEEAEAERKEVLQLEAEMEALKVEHGKLMEMKQQQQRQMQSQSVYQERMEQVSRMTVADNVQPLVNHLDGLFYLKDDYANTMGEAQDAALKQANYLQKLQNDYEFLCLDTDIQMMRLKRDLEESRLQRRTWENRFERIQKSATEKTVELVEIKVAALSLYEMIEGAKAVDINDTEKHLDKIAMFIKDQEEIVEKYYSSEAVRRCRSSKSETVSENNTNSNAVSHLKENGVDKARLQDKKDATNVTAMARREEQSRVKDVATREAELAKHQKDKKAHRLKN